MSLLEGCPCRLSDIHPLQTDSLALSLCPFTWFKIIDEKMVLEWAVVLLNNILDTKHPEAGGGNVELRSREGCMPLPELNSIFITAFLFLVNGMS